MCTSEPTIMISYGMKMPNVPPYYQLYPRSSQLSTLDFQQFQMPNYGMHYYPSNLGMINYPRSSLLDSYAQACLYKHGLRTEFVQNDPKPSHSYIALIAMAILSSKGKKLVLGDIYQWILDNYSYFRTRGTGWKNSIRHNLSLNECFFKSGRCANGKGHYWAIHKANVKDFQQGDFRRRRAQRKVRRFMGLSFPSEDEEDDDMPGSSSPTPAPNWAGRFMADSQNRSSLSPSSSTSSAKEMEISDNAEVHDKYDFYSCESNEHSDTSGDYDEVIKEEKLDVVTPSDLTIDTKELARKTRPIAQLPKKRMFDIESLLAPDINRACIQTRTDVLSADNKLQWTKLWTVYNTQFTPSDINVVSKTETF